MEIIKGLLNLTNTYSHPVITLGNFDGVHLGHQKTIQKVRDKAKETNSTSMIITFEPHPLRIIDPERELVFLTPFNIKSELIAEFDIDVLLCIEFSSEFAKVKAEDFIKDILVDKLHASHIIVGHDYRFGSKKQGNTDLLRKRGRQYGFTLNVIRNVKNTGGTISSSRIRKLLLDGDVHLANILLGRTYFIEGTVGYGAGRGAKVLNTPTANLTINDELAPMDGVYAVRVKVGDKIYDGVSNIGKNPTFGQNNLSYEVHLFDFEDDLRGVKPRVYFVKRIRSERTFDSPDELKKQILKDIDKAKKILHTFK
ncbi:MAG: bifunctional riboflavin kinase/FAD synthetase [Nitrospirae bacterium]|nr:bifunctional riboflavin kinase/FAD synthetase [Nitrospirota bacterium]